MVGVMHEGQNQPWLNERAEMVTLELHVQHMCNSDGEALHVVSVELMICAVVNV